jgi:PAS domain S-box-containing protein
MRNQNVQNILKLIENDCPEVKTQLLSILSEFQINDEELRAKDEELRQQSHELASLQLELEQSRQNYFDLYDLAPVGYLTFDANGLLLKMNRAAAELIGVESSMVIGMPIIGYVAKSYRERFSSHQSAVLETGRLQSCELQLIRRDGSSVYVKVQTRPVPAQSGELKLLSTLTDTPDRKLAERALPESDRLLRDVMDNMVAMIGLMNPDGTLIKANRAALEAANLKPEDVLGMPFEATYWWAWSPEVQQRLRAAIERCAAGQGSRYDELIRIGEHEFRTIDFMLAPMFGPDGGVAYLIPSGVDITERKQAEERILSVARFPAENPNPVMRATTDGRLLYANPASQALLDAWGTKVGNVLPDELVKFARNAFEEGLPHDMEVTCDSLTYLFSFTPISEESYINLYGRDITGRKQAETALIESEATLNTVLETLPAGIVIADADGRIVRDNAATRELWGIPPEMTSYGDWVAWWPETGERVKAQEWAMARALLRGEVTKNELIQNQRFNSDERRYYLNNVAPLLNERGRIVGGVAAMIDVTERLAAEQALRQSEERLRGFFTTNDIYMCIICLHQNDFEYVEVNQLTADQFFGRSVAEVNGKTGRELGLSEQTVREWMTLFEQCASKGKSTILDRSLDCRGTTRWYRGTITPLSSKQRGCPHFSLVALDDTERRQAEEALRQSEFFYRQTLESIPGMVFTTRPDGYSDYQSQQWVDYTGVPMREQLGDGWSELLHPDDRPHAFAAWRAAVEKNEPYDLEYRVRRHDGVYEWFRVIGKQIRDDAGRVVRWFGVAMNIEDLKQSEEKLRSALASAEEQRQILETMVEYIPLGITIADAPDMTIRAVSRYGREMTGKSRDLIEGIPVDLHAERWEVYHSDGQKLASNEELPLTRATQKGELIKEEEWVIGRADGKKFPILCTAAPIRDSEGNITGGVIGWQDITERKRMEEKLRESETRLSAILEQLPVGVGLLDNEGRFVLRNSAWKTNVFGEKMPSRNPEQMERWKTFDSDGKPVPPNQWPGARALRGEIVSGMEFIYTAEDGIEFWKLVYAAPFRLHHNEVAGAVTIVQDITARKNAERKLHELTADLEKKVSERTALAENRSKQLQALSVELIEAEERERKRIAQVLHDDLQQLLAGARLMLQSVSANLPPMPEIGEVQQLLEESIKKSRNLSHELSPAVLHHSGLVTALEWLTGQMKVQFGLNAALEDNTEITLENQPIKAFVFRAVQELLFNIVKHASLNSARIEVSNSPENFSVTVIDQGKGFDPEVLKRFQGKTGFGLLTIRERANYIGAQLVIDSAPGRGSRFTLKIPVDMVGTQGQQPKTAAGAAQHLEIQEMPAISTAAGVIRVLFADDHKVIRQGLIKLIAGQPGIHVVGEAANGLDAIEQARRLNPDVIVMDISMPEMDGIEATRRIKAELPEVRVVGLSMHDSVHISSSMCKAGAESVVNKASSPAQLLKAIYGVAQEKNCGI